MNKIFDSHSHYNDDAFRADYDNVLNLLKESGVGNVMNVGYDIQSSQKALEQAKKEDFMYCAVGIHPENAEGILKPDSLETLKKLAADPKVKAIGECGLDYHYEDAPEKDIQKQAFIRQIDLANELDLPMIIHTRDAMADTIDILTAHPLKNGVIHCYSGSRESCKQLIKMGFYIGFTGVITFKNARRAIESMKVVPLDKLLIETDCPYMAPEPNRGKRCDSSLLHFTAQKMADELGFTKDEIIGITNQNAKRVFKIE